MFYVIENLVFAAQGQHAVLKRTVHVILLWSRYFGCCNEDAQHKYMICIHVVKSEGMDKQQFLQLFLHLLFLEPFTLYPQCFHLPSYSPRLWCVSCCSVRYRTPHVSYTSFSTLQASSAGPLPFRLYHRCLPIGWFSEASLHEWMPFVIFCAISRERSQHHFRADLWVGVASRCV